MYTEQKRGLITFSPFAKLLILTGLVFLLIGIFSILYPVLFLLITGTDFKELANPNFLTDNWSFLTNMSLWQSICVFLVPSLLIAHWCGQNSVSSYLFLNRAPGFLQCLTAIALFFTVTPFIGLTQEWNMQMSFPESMSGLESWMREMEDTGQMIIDKILNVNSTAGWLFVFLVLSVLPGITEEILFRGVIQRLLLEKFKKVHLTVWVTAIIFSAIHFQFYGFLPRLLLGAFCGYLLVWSGNLWLPILAHTMNNAIVVLLEYAVKQGWTTAEAIETNSSWEVMVLAAAGLIIFFPLARWFRNRQCANYKQNVLDSVVTMPVTEIKTPEDINRTFSDER